MNPQLPPSHDFEEFVERAVAARQRNKSVSQIRHLGFALVHGFHFNQLAIDRTDDLFGLERTGNNANDTAAPFGDGTGNFAHQPDTAAAVDQTNATVNQ